MNNKALRRALRHYSNGRSIRDVAQFVDVEWRLLKRKFEDMGVESAIDARKTLEQLEEQLAQEAVLQNRRSKDDKGGQIVPEFKPEPTKHEFKFDRAAAIVNDKRNTQEKIPLSEHQTFREELRTRPWVHIVRKWTERCKLTEEELMEQAVLLSPVIAKDRFGFDGIDDNMEKKKSPRQ